MKVKVFYAPPGSRNITETLFSEVRWQARPALKRVIDPGVIDPGVSDPWGIAPSGILYLAPNQLMIDAGMRVFHKTTASPAYIQPEMLTLKQLSTRLCSLYSSKITLPESLIPVVLSAISGKGLGLATITAKFISEGQGSALCQKGSLTPANSQCLPSEPRASFFINVFDALGIPQAVLNRVLDAVKVFEQYECLMQSHDAISPDHALLLCPEIVKEKLSVDVLILNGFYEATNPEKALLHALITKAKTTLISIPISNNYPDISNSYIDFIKDNFNIEEVFLSPCQRQLGLTYHALPSQEEEVEAIARHIKASFISGRQRGLENVIIAFPELGQYRDTVERVMRRYGIPYAMANPKPLSGLRPFLDMFCLLESVADDYPRLSFSSFLISPYFYDIPQALKTAVPRLCSNRETIIIKGKDQWLRAFEAEGDEVYSGGKKVLKRLEHLESIKHKGSYTDYLKALNDLLRVFGFRDEAQADRDIKEIFKWLSMVDTIVGKDTDLRGFIDSLRHILNNSFDEGIGIGVQVMGMQDASGLEPDFIYIAGLKDGSLPSMPEIDHLLPDSVRGRLGLTNLKKHLMEQEFLFERLIANNNKGVYLTYPTMDGDKFFLPSLFLRDAKEKKERVSGIFSLEEELLSRTKNRVSLSAYIREIRSLKHARKRFSKTSYIYVTDIDGYRRCPRRFFIEKILGLEPPEIKDYGLEPTTIGTIIHEVMQRLIPYNGDDFDSFTEKAVSALNETLLNKPIDTYWKTLIRDSFLGILTEIYEIEESITADGYRFKAGEFPVEGEPLKGIRLKGKIDRIDEGQDRGLELIDYKTGTADFNSTQILKHGVSLQLFLYASLLRTDDKQPERVGIYSLKKPGIDWIPTKKDSKEGRTLNDYISSSLRFLEDTVKAMRQGDFTARPLNEQLCRRCHERPYCPYIQGEGG